MHNELLMVNATLSIDAAAARLCSTIAVMVTLPIK